MEEAGIDPPPPGIFPSTPWKFLDLDLDMLSNQIINFQTGNIGQYIFLKKTVEVIKMAKYIMIFQELMLKIMYLWKRSKFPDLSGFWEFPKV